MGEVYTGGVGFASARVFGKAEGASERGGGLLNWLQFKQAMLDFLNACCRALGRGRGHRQAQTPWGEPGGNEELSPLSLAKTGATIR